MKNLNSQIENHNPNKNHFKPNNLDEYSSENESRSIIEFDDEYSEVPSLYNNKNNQIINQEQQEEQINEEEEEEEEDIDNYYEYSDTSNIKYLNTIEKKMIDENLNQLMIIDTSDKQGVINILMKDHLILKKPKDLNEEIEEKNKNKKNFEKQRSKKEFMNNKKNTYGRNGYMIEAQEGDPEFVKDMNVAGLLLKEKIQDNNEDVAKLLFDEFTPTPSSRRILTRRQIGDKIKKNLEKKRKNLEKIEAEIYEEQKINETFTPSINRRKNDEYRRNFNLFLKDQSDYQKKIQQKKKNLLLKSESEKKLLYIGRPNINKNSEEMAKKINNNNKESVYIRLYKRQSPEKDKSKSDKKKVVEDYEQKGKKDKPRKNRYSYIKSKINSFRKMSDKDNNEKNKINVTEPSSFRERGLKKRTKSAVLTDIKKNIFEIKDLSTNKMLYNKFNKNFEEALKSLKLNINNNKNIEDLELNETQYHQLLYDLGMVSYELESNEKKNNSNINKTDDNTNCSNQESIIDNSLKAEEKCIFTKSFILLKINKDNDKIKIGDIKTFLIFVLNLQNYHFYHQFKYSHTQEELNTLFPLEKHKKEEIPELMLNMQNDALTSQIDKSKSKNLKYYSISTNNKIIFTLDKSNTIKKDFNLFSLNYRNKKPKTNNEEKIIRYIKKNILLDQK